MATDAPLVRPLTAQPPAGGTRAAVERFNAAFARRDFDGIMEAMTYDCVFDDTSPPDGTRHTGQADVRRSREQLFTASPAAAFHTEGVIVAGDRAVVTVGDDGAGGAVLDQGSGLQGLADRVEALAGAWSSTRPPGGEHASPPRFRSAVRRCDPRCARCRVRSPDPGERLAAEQGLDQQVGAVARPDVLELQLIALGGPAGAEQHLAGDGAAVRAVAELDDDARVLAVLAYLRSSTS